MPIAELLHNARFITNSLGEQTDVVISIDTWNTLVSALQQIQPPVEVLAEPEDETAYLLGNETNRKALLEAIDRVEARQDLVTFTPEEWNAQYNI